MLCRAPCGRHYAQGAYMYPYFGRTEGSWYKLFECEPPYRPLAYTGIPKSARYYITSLYVDPVASVTAAIAGMLKTP